MRRVEDIMQALWGTRVSDLNQKIYGQINEWRERPLVGESPYVYLDGLWLKRSWGGEVKNISVLVSCGCLTPVLLRCKYRNIQWTQRDLRDVLSVVDQVIHQSWQCDFFVFGFRQIQKKVIRGLRVVPASHLNTIGNRKEWRKSGCRSYDACQSFVKLIFDTIDSGIKDPSLLTAVAGYCRFSIHMSTINKRNRLCSMQHK